MFKDLKTKQSFTIAAITFWGQFAVYSFNAILILYLTKSAVNYGLGFTEGQAYSFQGVSQAMGYAVLMLGGYIADRHLGLRRSIFLGSLLAFIIAPALIDYKFGPLAVLSIVFIGKLIASLNFAYRYKMYDNVVDQIDKDYMPIKSKLIVIGYLIAVYILTLIFYQFPNKANVLLGFVGVACLAIFLLRTIFFLKSKVRIKQVVGLVLIVIAVVFFVIYNQMSSTLVMAAKNNSDLLMFGISVNAASYQMVNPVIIIFGGLILIRIYPLIPRFYIPYQFAVGVLLIVCTILWFYSSGTWNN